MNNVLNWIKDYLIPVLLPGICIAIGIILIIFGMDIGSMFNQNVGNILFLIGIILFLSGFVLPVYFFVRSIFTSLKDLSSKDPSLKISGILGIIFLAIFILSLRDYIFKMAHDTLTALIILFVMSFTFLIILMLIIKMLYLVISSLIRFLTRLKGKK